MSNLSKFAMEATRSRPKILAVILDGWWPRLHPNEAELIIRVGWKKTFRITAKKA